MCVYNGELYLKKSINSILHQTFNDFEFIIINDGSNDSSMQIINSYNDPRIKIINQLNIGLTKSLNKGIKVSKGRYIARIDADEIAAPTRFYKQITILEKYNEIGVIGSYCIDFYKIGLNQLKTISLPKSNHEIRSAMIKNNPFVHGSVMMRKKAIEEVGYYNESFKYVQDYELWGRISKLYKFQNLPIVLLKRIVTIKSITYNPSVMKERALFALKAQISVLKNLNAPLYSYIHLWRRILRFMFYDMGIISVPIKSKKDLLKTIFG